MNRRVFSGLFPETGPWTTAALWHGLDAKAVPQSPLKDEINTIQSQRLTPLLVRYLRENAPDHEVEVRRFLERQAMTSAAASARVFSTGAEISVALAITGIANVVAKGPAIARRYPVWADRPFSDLDLYVRVEAFPTALARCGELGLVEEAKNVQPWRGFDRACREAVNLVSPGGASLDLHHHVPPWFWGTRLRGADMIARGQRETLLGHELLYASDEDNLLIAALHVVSDKNRPGETLMIWRDLAQLAAVVDPERLAAFAGEAALSRWAHDMLTELPAAVRPDELIGALRSTSRLRGRRRLALLTSPRVQRVGVVATQPLRLPARQASLFLAGMAFPSRRFLTMEAPEDRHARRSWYTSHLSLLRRRTRGAR